MLLAPFERLIVQVREVPERSARKEVALYESDETLDLSFGERMSRFT
jgi:hypothetical protein